MTRDFQIRAVSDDPNDELARQVRAELGEIRKLVGAVTNGHNGRNGKNGDGVTIPKGLAVALTMFVLGLTVSVAGLILRHDKLIDSLRENTLPRIEAERDHRRIENGCPTVAAERRLQRLESTHGLDIPPCVRS